MADQKGGGISWTEQTWNPIRGCSRVSEGCRACYAEKTAARFSGPGMPYEGLAVLDDRGARWTGVVRLVEERLDDPLRWTRPRLIFANSMSDVFHEALDGQTIARVFAVMAMASRHTFQVLTKRAKRMWEFMNDPAFRAEVAGIAAARSAEVKRGVGLVRADEMPWPLPNVWMGVSAENQTWANDRIMYLTDTPAAIRWVSAEPLLGPIDLDWIKRHLTRLHKIAAGDASRPWIDWVVVGGESGPDAAPMEAEWAWTIQAEAWDQGVAVFNKQLGNRLAKALGRDGAGKLLEDWPVGLRTREYPARYQVTR